MSRDYSAQKRARNCTRASAALATLLLLSVSPAPAPAQSPPANDADRGAIAGAVVYDGPRYPMQPINMDADPRCVAQHTEEPARHESLVLGDAGTLGNVLVEVIDGPALGLDTPVPTEPATLDQHGCRYSPRVLVVRAGQPLRILNPDGTTHNVHMMARVNDQVNLGMRPDRTEAIVTFDEPEEIFPVKCDVHPWMRAYCAVVTHPFHAVTPRAGDYAIDGLTPGTYTVRAWHELLGTREAEVDVRAGETATLNFTFSRSRGSGR